MEYKKINIDDVAVLKEIVGDDLLKNNYEAIHTVGRGSAAGYESRLTIGIVLISGIIFSVLLTLFITPYFFKILDKKS